MNRKFPFLLVILLLGAAALWWWNAAGVEQSSNVEPLEQSAHRVVRRPFQSLNAVPTSTGEELESSSNQLSPRLLELNREGLQALQNNHAEQAVSSFEAALELDPEHSILKANLASALVAWAVEEQEAGSLSTAMQLLARAIETDPSAAGGYYWLAHLHLRQGNRIAAKEVLDAALAVGVQHATLLRMRADIAAVEGELEQSVDLVERALALEPEQPALQERAAQLRAERDMFHSFLTDATAHFDSRYDPQDQAIVAALDELNRDLEAAWQDVVGVLGVQPQDRLLVIWLDADRYRWQAPSWSAALFDGRVRIVIEDYERDQQMIRRTLRHELTHAVLHTMGVPLPTWFHEGLAQSAEGRDPQVARAQLARERPRMALSEMVGNWTTWTDRGRVTEAYAYSLAFCDWLRAEFGSSVMTYFFLNLKGRTFEEAWSLTFGQDLGATDAGFRDFLETL